MDANEVNILHKDIWITVKHDASVLRGFVFQKEYYINEKTSVLILILQHEYYRYALADSPAFSWDVYPVPCIDYRVFVWEGTDDNMGEFKGIINTYENNIFITGNHRCQMARADLTGMLLDDPYYTHYQIDLRVFVDEPLHIMSESNIVF